MKNKYVGFFVVCLFFVNLAVINVDVHAASFSGTCFFNGGTCQTKNPPSISQNDVFSGRSVNKKGQVVGQAIPNKLDVNGFINFIDFYFHNGGGARNKTGADFLIQKMRGATGRPGEAEFNDWKARMGSSVSTDDSIASFTVTSFYDNSKNDDFFANYPGSDIPVLRIILNGKVYAYIEKGCGNLLANSIPLPVVNNWTLSATSTANVATAKPGDVIQWTHKLTNDGPDATSANVESNLGMSGFSNGWSTGLADSINAAGAAKGLMRTIANYAAYTVTQADVGNTLCEWVQYSPTDSKGNIDGRATHACVTIPYVYTLTPTLITDVSGAIESGTTVNATPKVANSGPTRSDNTNWQLTQTIVLPGKSIPNVDGGTSASPNTPCNTYFQSLPNATCSVVNSGTSVFEAITGNVLSGTPLSTSAVPVGDLAVGTKVCFAFSIQPRASDSTEWRHSAPVCLIIGKKPKTQVLGSDLSVGRGFSSIVGSTPTTASVITSSTLKNIAGTPRMFGSWIEYGIFATGVIKGAGSGSAYADTGMDNYSACRAGQLSFVNTNVGDSNCNGSTVIGNFSTAQSIPDASTSFPVSISTPTLGGTISLNGLSGVYKGNGADITINASPIDKGQWVVINAPNSNVMIAGNINYTNEKLQSIYDIPQLVIIGKNITINDSVTNVDAWLVARGTNNAQGVLATCSSVSPLTASMCKDPLIVNGPIMAQKLVLLRTAGSGTGASSGDPAETFNLRPDAYLWSFARASAGGHIQTVYSQELPPRF